MLHWSPSAWIVFDLWECVVLKRKNFFMMSYKRCQHCWEPYFHKNFR